MSISRNRLHTAQTLIALIALLSLAMLPPSALASQAAAPLSPQLAGTCALSPGQVLINEFVPAESAGNDWVEFYNTTSATLNLQYCYLDDVAGSGSAPYQITASTPILPGNWVVITRPGTFNNSGEDYVRLLKEDQTTVLDEWAYRLPGENYKDLAWQRSPDGGEWACAWSSTPTRGTTNPDVGPFPTPWVEGSLEIRHLDVGQADSTLVIGPQGNTLLIDVGEEFSGSDNGCYVGRYIDRLLHTRHLDYIAITHMHDDHIGAVNSDGLWYMVEKLGFTAGRTFHRDYNNYVGDTGQQASDWIDYLATTGTLYLTPTLASTHLSWNLGQVGSTPVYFQFLSIDGGGALYQGDFRDDAAPPSENDYSMALEIACGNFNEFIGGDMSGMYAVRTDVSDPYSYHDIELGASAVVSDVDVYRVNHHGSSYSSNQTFIDQLDPEVSIVSVGDTNTYHHPSQDVLARLLTSGSDVYMTEQGESNAQTPNVVVAHSEIIVRTANGSSYTVSYGSGSSVSYAATKPNRPDADGDGYYGALNGYPTVDPNDSSDLYIPQPNGGCNPTYQNCSAPDTFTSYTPGLRAITLAWNDVPDASQYCIYRSTSQYGNYSPVQCVDDVAGSSTYTYKDRPGRGTYYYVLTTMIYGAESPYSTPFYAKTLF